jgi:hypothetical protein
VDVEAFSPTKKKKRENASKHRGMRVGEGQGASGAKITAGGGRWAERKKVEGSSNAVPSGRTRNQHVSAARRGASFWSLTVFFPPPSHNPKMDAGKFAPAASTTGYRPVGTATGPASSQAEYTATQDIGKASGLAVFLFACF